MDGRNMYPDIIRSYIDMDFITPYFQPLTDIRNGRCCGAEVLARVAHSELGILQPSSFILPETSEEDLALLTRVLMCRAGSALQNVSLRQNFILSFNITPAVLTAAWLPVVCQTLIEKTNSELTVVLELTEQRQLSDATMVFSEHLRLLREAGIRLALDDFGTGWSGLALLLQTGADILKIPREFVAAMGKLPRADQIVDTILELANRLGMEVIAEGVEQHFQVELLASRGVRLCQGAYYSMPLNGEEFTDYLIQDLQILPCPRGGQEKTSRSVRGAVTECARRYALSLRETEVLVQLAEGQPLFDQAREANRSVKTRSVQKRSAYRKMGIKNDVEFMHYLYSIMDVHSVI